MLLDPRVVEAKSSAQPALRLGRFLVAVAAIVAIVSTSYAEGSPSCASDGACPPDQSTDWRPAYLAQFPSFPDLSASASEAVTAGSESTDSTFEFSRDSTGLTLYKGDIATTADTGRYQLTWHDAALTAKDGSGLLRLQSQTLQAAFDPIEGIHLDTRFGGIAPYLYQQSPIGAVKASGKIGSIELAIAVNRQLQTDSLETIRKGLFSTETAVSAKRKLFGGFKIKAEIHHRDFSDGNSSNSIQLAPEYDRQIFGMALGLGSRFSYMAFERHSMNGYYNPLVSYGQQVFMDANYDSGRFYFNFDIAGGRGTSKNSATSAPNSDFSGEGAGTLGWKIGRRFLAELTASGGDYGLNYPAKGWAQMSTGFKLNYWF
jgi:hypothetical protein